MQQATTKRNPFIRRMKVNTDMHIPRVVGNGPARLILSKTRNSLFQQNNNNDNNNNNNNNNNNKRVTVPRLDLLSVLISA